MVMLDKARFGDERVEDLVATAKSMQPYLLEMAPKHEQDRRLDAEVINKLLAADMFKVAVPRRWADSVCPRMGWRKSPWSWPKVVLRRAGFTASAIPPAGSRA